VRHLVWHPEDFGLRRSSASGLRVCDALESAAQIRRVFARESGPVRDYILANASAALWLTERCDLREGVEIAARAIDSGAALHLLERWRDLAPIRPQVQ
jgi:anthranilate phosphoribosyltransferase